MCRGAIRSHEPPLHRYRLPVFPARPRAAALAANRLIAPLQPPTMRRPLSRVWPPCCRFSRSAGRARRQCQSPDLPSAQFQNAGSAEVSSIHISGSSSRARVSHHAHSVPVSVGSGSGGYGGVRLAVVVSGIVTIAARPMLEVLMVTDLVRPGTHSAGIGAE